MKKTFIIILAVLTMFSICLLSACDSSGNENGGGGGSGNGGGGGGGETTTGYTLPTNVKVVYVDNDTIGFDETVTAYKIGDTYAASTVTANGTESVYFKKQGDTWKYYKNSGWGWEIEEESCNRKSAEILTFGYIVIDSLKSSAEKAGAEQIAGISTEKYSSQYSTYEEHWWVADGLIIKYHYQSNAETPHIQLREIRSWDTSVTAMGNDADVPGLLAGEEGTPPTKDAVLPQNVKAECTTVSGSTTTNKLTVKIGNDYYYKTTRTYVDSTTQETNTSVDERFYRYNSAEENWTSYWKRSDGSWASSEDPIEYKEDIESNAFNSYLTDGYEGEFVETVTIADVSVRHFKKESQMDFGRGDYWVTDGGLVLKYESGSGTYVYTYSVWDTSVTSFAGINLPE